MVKRIISKLLVLTVLTVFLAACSQTSDYIHMIPADATAVVAIDLKSLAGKAGLNDKENEAAKQKILEVSKSGMNAATFLQLEKVVNHPGESGIDVTSPVYGFSAPSFPYPSLIGKVSNEENLHTLLDAMAKEQICQPVNETADYRFTTMSGNLIAFNSSAVIIVSVSGTSLTEKAKEGIAALMKQSADNSIAASNVFRQIEKQKSDVSFFVSMATLPPLYRNQIGMGLPDEAKPEDIILIGRANAEKGKITLQTEYYTDNETVGTLLKKNRESFGKPNGTFTKYFPASTLLYCNIALKGEEFYNLLSENEEFRNTVSIAKADELKELFQSFNGDISAGLINITMNSVPTFMLYAEVKNGDVLESLYNKKESLGLKKGEEILKLGKDEYVYKIKGRNVFAKDINVFFGIKEKQMYVTNDELLYKNIGKTADKSVKEAPYASEMKGKSTFVGINADAIFDLPVVKMLAGLGGPGAKTYLDMANKVSYLSMSANRETSEIILCLKDKDTNALKQVVEFVKQFAGI